MRYSLDFRLQVLDVKKKKALSFAETAERFGVGIARVVRWSKKPEPQTHRHKPCLKIKSLNKTSSVTLMGITMSGLSVCM